MVLSQTGFVVFLLLSSDGLLSIVNIGGRLFMHAQLKSRRFLSTRQFSVQSKNKREVIECKYYIFPLKKLNNLNKHFAHKKDEKMLQHRFNANLNSQF